jgi:hypothetical protein
MPSALWPSLRAVRQACPPYVAGAEQLNGLHAAEAADAPAGLEHERHAHVALLHSDADRREFISAGAAAGLAVRGRLHAQRRVGRAPPRGLHYLKAASVMLDTRRLI